MVNSSHPNFTQYLRNRYLPLAILHGEQELKSGCCLLQFAFAFASCNNDITAQLHTHSYTNIGRLLADQS
jgi:hypothetical protein